MLEVACVNGEFLPLDRATVSVEDRGFQFGDAVYEVMVTYDGRLFRPQEHLRRLRQSAEAIELDYPFDDQPLLPLVYEGLRRSGLRDAVVYIQVTRGAAPRSLMCADGTRPTTVITFRPRPVVSEEVRRRGLRVMTTPEVRWSNCYVKAVTLLPNVLARHRAVRSGHDDAVFVTPEGHLRECTASNVFVVSRGRVTTPRRTQAILHGVTQLCVLQCAERLNIPWEERDVPVADLRAAEEAFLSSTTSEILAITSVDGQAIGDGRPGAITRRLHEEFLRLVNGD